MYLCFAAIQIHQIPNTYNVIYMTRGHGLSHKPEHITFTDSSVLDSDTSPPPHKKQQTTQSGSVGNKVPRGQHGIALPNPHFLHIHSAIAGILHMSGAGREIDAAINRTGWCRGAVVGDDLDRLFLQECLSAIFTS